jgi:hypothetical protein
VRANIFAIVIPGSVSDGSDDHSNPAAHILMHFSSNLSYF